MFRINMDEVHKIGYEMRIRFGRIHSAPHLHAFVQEGPHWMKDMLNEQVRSGMLWACQEVIDGNDIIGPCVPFSCAYKNGPQKQSFTIILEVKITDEGIPVASASYTDGVSIETFYGTDEYELVFGTSYKEVFDEIAEDIINNVPELREAL